MPPSPSKSQRNSTTRGLSATGRLRRTGTTWLQTSLFRDAELGRAVYGEEHLPETPLAEVLEGLGGNLLWLAVAALIVVAAAPIAEELLMRGALWNALAHHRVPPWVILVVTAVVFAYLHAEPARTVPLVAQGIAFGAARMITGRTSAAVVAHAANNAPPAALLLTGGFG
jgi:membrane protease YdiL (CAAX protease family)